MKKIWAYLKKYKLYWIGLISLGVAVAAGWGINYALTKPKATAKKVNYDPQKRLRPLSQDLVFNDLVSSDFYDAVEIKKGKIYLNENIVAAIITDQIRNSAWAYADLEYRYQRLNDQQILLNLKIIDENKNSLFKTWNLEARNV